MDIGHGTMQYRVAAYSKQGEDTPMLWTVCAVLVVLWLLGFSLHVGGSLIHLLLVVAVIVIVFNLLTGGRAVA